MADVGPFGSTVPTTATTADATNPETSASASRRAGSERIAGKETTNAAKASSMASSPRYPPC
ncbi:MAG: hypothetical protein IPH55_17120 [Betaproteobacteria bacterium]|nr:hypothetical protein [Betaproteobacteria bacterium]